jgi:guanine deaminase
MTIYRACVLDTPDDPFRGGVLRSDEDAGLLVRDGAIVDRAGFAAVAARYPDEDVADLRDGLLLPGLIDTHVHFPQLRCIGALGMPLLDWLEQCALPEEARLREVAYASELAAEFVAGLAFAGTTSALVFGAHFAPAVDALFAAASRAGLRITAGLVVSDRRLRDDLHTTPERAYAESRALADRWHGAGRLRYAVTPRFALSCSDEMLAACGALLTDVAGSWLTTHLNENSDEIAAVHELSGGRSYAEAYDRHALVGARSVFAHDVHPTDLELKLLAAAGASVAHCPSSNASLGSGLFPLDRHVAAGVPVALGTDVGAGTGLSLFKEGLQAYFAQRLRGADGVPLTATHLLHLATAAGAAALGIRELVGDLAAGRRFDAVWVRPPADSALSRVLVHADGPESALAKVFTLATSHDVAQVWVDGTPVKHREGPA